MDNETDGELNSFAGKIICVSDRFGRIGAKMKGALHLTTDQVKAKAVEIYSESDVRHVLEKIPQLYKFKSTVFTNLGKWKDGLSNVGKDSWAEVFYLFVWHYKYCLSAKK